MVILDRNCPHCGTPKTINIDHTKFIVRSIYVCRYCDKSFNCFYGNSTAFEFLLNLIEYYPDDIGIGKKYESFEQIFPEQDRMSSNQ